jgi:hypothetical protein
MRVDEMVKGIAKKRDSVFSEYARVTKVLAVLVNLPIDLAVEIFRESGNLPISEFPASLKFAESIAETLNMEQNEHGEHAEPTVVCKSEEKMSVSAKHKR